MHAEVSAHCVGCVPLYRWHRPSAGHCCGLMHSRYSTAGGIVLTLSSRAPLCVEHSSERVFQRDTTWPSWPKEVCSPCVYRTGFLRAPRRHCAGSNMVRVGAFCALQSPSLHTLVAVTCLGLISQCIYRTGSSLIRKLSRDCTALNGSYNALEEAAVTPPRSFVRGLHLCQRAATPPAYRDQDRHDADGGIRADVRRRRWHGPAKRC